ncbi:MAG TPA: S-layer homology domain-containing protein [Thermoanaerobaculia bacterium]|nr:S-layer homology domain-containing protein [Thermoanaerobaculia bacterium]
MASGGAAVAAAILLGAARSLAGLCGPFTDVSDVAFCPFVLEIFYLGITTGTTATTYDPTSPVTRLQMAAFLSRSVDSALKRGSRRTALNQFWVPQGGLALAQTTVQFGAGPMAFDGIDLWVASSADSTLLQVRPSDGRILATWTADSANGLLAALGKIFVTGYDSNVFSGLFFMIDPSLGSPGGFATLVSSSLPFAPSVIAYDGSRFWTSGAGTVSMLTPTASPPWTVTTATAGFLGPSGLIYDGANVWAADPGNLSTDPGRLLKLDSSAAILQTITVGKGPGPLLFDGASIWVPNFGSDSISVVRSSSGVLLQTLTGNGMSKPSAVAFDGERVLVADFGNDKVSLWKAADLTPLGSFSVGAGSQPTGACSDGINFWVTFFGTPTLQRF